MLRFILSVLHFFIFEIYFFSLLFAQVKKLFSWVPCFFRKYIRQTHIVLQNLYLFLKKLLDFIRVDSLTFHLGRLFDCSLWKHSITYKLVISLLNSLFTFKIACFKNIFFLRLDFQSKENPLNHKLIFTNPTNKALLKWNFVQKCIHLGYA